MILCLPLVSVLVIAGFELKSGEAAATRGHSGTGFVRANRSASNRLTRRANIPDIVVSSFYFIINLSVHGGCILALAFDLHIVWQLT